jgi:hypothetical protein
MLTRSSGSCNISYTPRHELFVGLCLRGFKVLCSQFLNERSRREVHILGSYFVTSNTYLNEQCTLFSFV